MIYAIHEHPPLMLIFSTLHPKTGKADGKRKM